jgi:hypothetical protein
MKFIDNLNLIKFNSKKLDFEYYTHLYNNFSNYELFSDINKLDLEEMNLNPFSVFHTSVPNVKLYYPEPFIATPTFIHDDL